ncbi:MAG: DUF4238 domain-containing protein [Proteobacteria bacterium]|nr:DUF4238 domain-containing protein [Pseudomonadota bacterium]
MKQNNAKKQHFVPRFILNRFALDPKAKNKQVFVFDKWEERDYLNSVKNVGCQNGCYNFEGVQGTMSLEPQLMQLDGWASGIISKIIHAERLDVISPSEHYKLGLFLAVQFTRTKEYKDNIKQFTKELFDLAERLSGARILNGEPEPTAQDDQSFFVSQVAGAAGAFTNILLKKIWFLYKAPKNEYFYISDNPLVRMNHKDMGPYGNLGLASPEVEVYMPLSRSLTLGMLCPSFGDKFIFSLGLLKAQKGLGVDDPTIDSQIAGLESLMKAMQGGPASVCSSENVEYVNHLQVCWARRYVYAPKSDFDLARRMLADNPKFKQSIKPTFS